LNDFDKPWRAALASYQAGQFAEAESLCREIISAGAKGGRPPFLLGMIMGKTGRWREAVEHLRRAESLDPNAPEIPAELGRACNALGEYASAADCFARFVSMRPENADGHFALGNACQQLGENERAVFHYHRALELNPRDSGAWNNLGKALTELLRLEEAVAAFDQALDVRADYPLARRNRAIALLKRGRFEEGWRDFESRRSLAEPRRYPQPMWNGEPVGSLFVHAEQGLGDSIQFVRFLRLARPLAGRIILECQPPLARWFEASRCADAIVAVGQTPPNFDAFIPLLSLPRVFRTTLETIPTDVPYLSPPKGRELPELPAARLKVGFVWAGNPSYGRDHVRSVPLELFLPLLKTPHVSLFSFQVDAAPADVEILRGLPNVVGLAEHIRDMADAAALADQMDLVITVDTAMAHVAGALGKRVWTLLPHASDWRWLMERTDTPWYPTMRLFRQPRRGAWDEVVSAVRGELEQFRDRAAVRG
jgi:tetratricopeptide (TPR) repeat protein